MDAVTLEDWLAQLAARQPTPGGGGAAALLAAIAAGLAGMVSNYTTGEKWAEVASEMKQIAIEAGQLRLQALELMAADVTAFQAVGQAYALPKQSEAQQSERQLAIQEALSAAAEPPLMVAELTAQLLLHLSALATKGNPNVLSDVAVASSAARAALEAAIINIEINAKAISGVATKQRLQQAVQAAELAITQATELGTQVRQKVNT